MTSYALKAGARYANVLFTGALKPRIERSYKFYEFYDFKFNEFCDFR